MAVLTGKLSFAGKWKILFYDEVKQKESNLFCQKDVFSDDFQPKQDEETEVDFERDLTPQKNPIRVRAKGQEWKGQEKPVTPDYSRQTPPRKPKWEDRNRRDFKTQPKGSFSQTLEGEFHNPYNFVPAVPRENIANGLGDAEPVGHDRFRENHFSGKVTVKMTVETPVVVLNTAKVGIDQNDHKSFPVSVDSQGKPLINPTAVKGMLRSAYEAVTNSRLSVFTKHQERLAFRPEVGQGASVVPIRLEEDENGVKRIVFYSGTNDAEDLDIDGSPIQGNPLCAAWLPRYFDKEVDKFAPKFKGKDLPQHQEEVRVWIEKFAHWRWYKRNAIHRQDFVFWRVREIARINETLNAQPRPTEDRGKRNGRSYYQPLNEVIEAEGVTFISNHNMQRKHDEKIFFKNPKSPQSEVLLEDKWQDLQTAWKELIENYRAEHEIVKGKLEPVPKTLGIKEWSTHIQLCEKEKELKPGMLCFAEVEKNGTDFFVKRLFPVTISRQLFEASPDSLLDDALKPAVLIEDVKNQDGTIKHKSEMSPADRVFGFVRQKRKDENGEVIPFRGKVVGHRGQLRIGSVICNGLLEKNDGGKFVLNREGETIQPFDDMPLNILGQPKPQQGRFYVAEDKDGKAQTTLEINEGAGYKDPKTRGLRGRKVYPHHASLPKGYWFEESKVDFGNGDNLKSDNQFREYLRPPGEKQRNNQNRSIEGWIKPKTEFEFDIHVNNLSKVELGALVWLLDLPEDHFHRFGGGKPYGFGSVKLEITGCDVRDGTALKTFYSSLDDTGTGRLTNDEMKKLGGDFKDLADSTFPTVINAFLRACEGFSDKPTHYPRTSPTLTADTKSYEWFVENSKIEKGTVKHGYVLQDLANDDGLPYFRNQGASPRKPK